MPTSDSLREALELFRAQERKVLEDLKGIRFTIQNIERVAGIESTEPEFGEPPAIAALLDSSPAAPGGKPKLRADEFFGLTHAEAARRYLKKVGCAVSFDELAEALQQGGCKLTGAHPQKVLYISLVRNTRDFVPPRPGFVGLREFYPARARATNDRLKGKLKSLRTRKPRIAAWPEDQAKSRKKGEVSNAVLAAMGDGRARSLEELADIVSEKLGRPVKDFAIRGSLSGKQNIAQSGAKFKLIG